MGMAELNAVRRGFELFSVGREDAVYARLPDDFVLRDNVILEGTVLEGSDAVQRNLESVEQAFEDTSWAPVEYRDLGSQVAVRVHFEGTGRESGARVTADVGQLWTFRDGVAVRFEIFPSMDEALAAAK